jgi:hypothetical protein
MSRITRTDVERAVEQYRATGIGVGVLADTDTLELHAGSATAGIGWFLYLERADGSRSIPPAIDGSGRLGTTARESHANLAAITRAWWAVATVERVS